MLILYLEIDLHDIEAEIKGIKLGPFAGNDLIKCSINDLLGTIGLANHSVSMSDIPIRNYYI